MNPQSSPPLAGTAKNGNGHLRPFIPAWLDDLDLQSAAFRVLCHLWRRADRKNQCWPGAKSIVRACRINRDTLWPILSLLETRQLLMRTKTGGNRNLYTLLTPRGDGGKGGPTLLREKAEEEGSQSAGNKGRHMAEREGYKGSPEKGIQRTSIAPGAAAPGREWNELFDALITATGANPSETTQSAKGAVGKALKEIRDVCPDLTPAEINRRAANYRKRMPKMLLSASALAKHWAACDKTGSETRLGENLLRLHVVN